MRRLPARTLLVILLIVPAACGSDGGEEAGGTTQPTPTTTTAEYCARLADYDGATDTVDTSSAASMLASFSRAADAAGAAAKVAPNEIRGDQERIAQAAATLVAEIRKRNPRTVAEYQKAAAEVQPQLEARYGTLDPETAKLVEFGKRVCGIDM